MRIAGALLCSGCGMLSLSCSSPSEAHTEKVVAASEVPVVAVAPVRSESFSRNVVLTGEFRPFHVIDLHAKTAGYLKRIHVDVGDRVKEGQLLAELENPELEDELVKSAADRRRSDAELLRARGEMERAEANRAIVDMTHSRLSAVTRSEPGLIAQQELDELAARKRAAEAQVSAAKAALAAAEQQIEIARASEKRNQTMLGYSRIVAPFSGIIMKRFADPGAMIQAGTASQSQAMPVVRLAQFDRLRLVVPVPETHVARIRVGSPVSVRITSLNRTFDGAVSRFGGDVQTATRTMDVEIDVANANGLILPGMYADAALTLERRSGSLAVPVQALSARDGKKFVMIVNAERAIEEREIVTGIETAERIEVLRGLSSEDQVVVGNRSQLRPGQKVEPRSGGVG
jgi:RND family efflux transporter MFP subunit